ncbi:MAG: hypothetical protein DMG06_20040 [Acidobacteria bacterium]|nr:MAG: hypothetical protein DMG06_20040 [Acidobacteriota bacterium]
MNWLQKWASATYRGFLEIPSVPIGFHNVIAYLGYTLAAFVVGGYVMGLMAERVLIFEPLLAALGSLLLDLLFTQAGLLKGAGVFLFSLLLQAGNYKDAWIIAAIGIVAAIAGAFVGERWAIPQEDWVSQSLLAIGLLGLLLGPFFLLGTYLPTGYLLIVGAALLAGILIAAYRFGKSDDETKDISIKPNEPCCGKGQVRVSLKATRTSQDKA